MAATVIFPRRALFALVVALVVVIAGAIAFVYLPKAKVTVTPAMREHAATQKIVLSTNETEPDFVKFVLPARVLEQEVEESATIIREGASVLEDFAKGEVVLVNGLDEEQQLLPKTNLRHEATGVFFLTDTPVAIPAHGSVAMRVTAKEKGERGNVPAGRFLVDKLDPRLQDDVYAESSFDFTGGIAVESPLTEEELATAKEELVASASERALGELTAQASGAGVREELTAIDILEESTSAEAGSKTREFTTTVRVRARAILVDENDLLSLTLLALRSGPGEDEEFVSYKPESFSAEIIRADFERGEAQVTTSLSGVYARKVSPAALNARAVTGLSATEAVAKLESEASVGSAAVELSPFWVTSVPARAGAVEIVIEPPG